MIKHPAVIAREAGLVGFSVVLSVTVMLVIALVYLRPVPQVIPATSDHTFTAAVGAQGFKVGEFCADSQTTVAASPAPEDLTVYQLTRGRDEKLETVTIVAGTTGETKMATHYYNVRLADGTVVQQSEPAFADEDAWACIHKKAG